MLTLRLSKNIAEQVTSGPMAGHPVTPGWPTVRGRVALSSPVDKVGIEIGQLEDGGSNGDDIMSILAIESWHIRHRESRLVEMRMGMRAMEGREVNKW